ncbi:MAG: phosphatase PAP2 family protein, partial [Dehalococcoidia bacterium]
LTAGARATARFPGDLRIERAVQAVHIPAFGGVLNFESTIGGPLPATILIVVLALILIAVRHIHLAMTFILTNSLRIVDSLVKVFVNRPRPSATLVHVTENGKESSFPSGHVFSAVLLYGVLLVLIEMLPLPRVARRSLQTLCAVVAVLMGPARVYAGMHWPSDVLGGYLWGGLLLLLMLHATHVYGLFHGPPSKRSPRLANV